MTELAIYKAFVKNTAKASGKIGEILVGGTFAAAFATPAAAIGLGVGTLASPFAALIGSAIGGHGSSGGLMPGSSAGGFFVGLLGAPLVGAANGASYTNPKAVYKASGSVGHGIFKTIMGGAAVVVGSPLIIVDGIVNLVKIFNSNLQDSVQPEAINNNNNNNNAAQTTPSKPKTNQQNSFLYFNTSDRLRYAKDTLSTFQASCYDKKGRSNAQRLVEIIYGANSSSGSPGAQLPSAEDNFGIQIKDFLIQNLSQDWFNYLHARIQCGNVNGLSPEAIANPYEFAQVQATENINSLLSEVIDETTGLVPEIPVTCLKQSYDLTFLIKYSAEYKHYPVGQYFIPHVPDGRYNDVNIAPNYSAQGAIRRLEISSLSYTAFKNKLSPQQAFLKFHDIIANKREDNHTRLAKAAGVPENQLITKLIQISRFALQNPRQEFYRQRFMNFVPVLSTLARIPSVPCRDPSGKIVDGLNYQSQFLTPDYASQNAIETMITFLQGIRLDLNPQQVWEAQAALNNNTQVEAQSNVSRYN